MEDSVFAEFGDSSSGNFDDIEQNVSVDKYNKDCSAQLGRREEEQVCASRLCYNNSCNSKVDSNESDDHKYGEYYGKDDNRIDNTYYSSNETRRDACKLISMIEHVEPSTLPSAAPSRYEQTFIHEPLITHIPTLCTTINDGVNNHISNASNCCDDRNASKESNKVIGATPNVAFIDVKNTITHNETCNINKKEELHLEHQSRKYTQNDSNTDDDDDNEFEDKAFVNSAVHDRKCNTQDKLHKQRKQVELHVQEEQRNQTHDLPTTAKNEQSDSNSFAISNTSIHDKPLVPNCNNLVEHIHTKFARKHGTHRHHKKVNNNTTSASYSKGIDKSDSHRNNNNTNTSDSKELSQSESGTSISKHFSKDTSSNLGKVQQYESNKKEEYKCKNDENNNNINNTTYSNINNNKNIYYSYLIGHHSNVNDKDNSVEQLSQVQNKEHHQEEEQNHNNAHSMSFAYSNTSLQVEESVSSRNASSSVGNKYIKNANYSSGDDDSDDSSSSNNHDHSGNDHVSEEEHSELASNDNSVDESGHTAAERSFIDEFGFVIDEETKAKNEQYLRALDGRQVARREVK